QQNPFEAVPQSTEPPKPQPPKPASPRQPPLETPKAAQEPEPEAVENTHETNDFRGDRHYSHDTPRAHVITKKGDRLDPDALRRDFMALWNMARFDDITLETEPGKAGIIVRFILVERRVVRSIKYEGIKSVTVSEILDRFKERKVGLSVES